MAVLDNNAWTCLGAAGGGATVDLLNPGSVGDSTTSGSPSGLEYISGDLTIVRGCDDTQILRWNDAASPGGAWECSDETVAGGITGGDGIDVTAGTVSVDLYDAADDSPTSTTSTWEPFALAAHKAHSSPGA